MFRRSHPAPQDASSFTDERRSHERHAADVATVCRPLAGDASLPARIRNVSRTGVNLILPQPLAEGTMVRVNLPASPGGPHTTVLACVMHGREIGPGEWSVGCAFSLELSAEEMRLFGGEKSAAGPDDQRAWVRYPAKGLVLFRLVAAADGPARTAEVADLSPGGVGLILTEKLEPGAALTVHLRRTNNRPDWPMLACVVYLTDRPDGKWAAGCHFLRELSEAELNELVWRSGA